MTRIQLTFAFALTLPAAAQEVALTLAGAAPTTNYGSAVALLPDVDGDGTPDLAVGAPNEAPAGVVRVLSGRDGAVLRTLAGATPGAQFGASLAIAPDLDGGGLRDLVIGAPGTTFSHANQGTAYAYTLEDGARWMQLFGSGANARMGLAVANVGDVDGDGIDDLAAGEPGGDSLGYVDNGRVVLVSGATLQLLGVAQGIESHEQLGFAVSAFGDVDGDGYDDWLAGAPFHSAFGNQGGRVLVVHGGDHGAWWSMFGGHQGAHFGMALQSLGDMDGDGVPECVVGAPDHAASGSNQGRVAWFEGLAAQPHEEALGAQGERLGRALAAADVDGDGRPEVLAGAPNHVPGTIGRVGAVHVFDAESAAALATWPGFAVNGEFGQALAAGIDVNGDGRQDALVGARSEAASRGAARLVLAGAGAATPYCVAKVTSLGCTPRIQASGAASLSVGDGVRISAYGVTPSAAGLMFHGLAPAAHPLHGGTLCVQQSLRRTPVQTSSVGAAGCSSAFHTTLTPAALAMAGLAAGDVVHAQYWWRDNGFPAPGNIGLSDAIAVIVVP